MLRLRANTTLSVVACVFLIKLLLFSTILINDPDFFARDADTTWYTNFTNGFVEFGGFVAGGSGNVEFFRLPGYSAFLVPFWSIDEPYRYAWISIFQLIIGHVWLAFAADTLAKRLTPAVGIAFVLLLSVHFLFNHTVGSIQSEALFIPLVTFPLFAVLRIPIGASTFLMGFLSAFAFAGAHLTRPDILYLPALLLLLAIGMLISGRRNKDDVSFRQGKVLMVGLMGGLAAIGAWSFRNLLLTGTFMMTSHTSHVMAVVKYRLFGINIGTNRNLCVPLCGAHLEEYTGLDVIVFAIKNLASLFAHARQVFVNLFLRPQRWYLHRYADSFNVSNLVVKEPFSVDLLPRLTWLEFIYMGYVVFVNMVFLALTMLGIWFLCRRPGLRLGIGESLLVLLPLLYFFLVQLVWGGDGRFATYMLPFMAVLAALVFLNVGNKLTPDSGRKIHFFDSVSKTIRLKR